MGNSLMLISLLIILLNRTLIAYALLLVTVIMQFFCYLNNKGSDLVVYNILVVILMLMFLTINITINNSSVIYNVIFGIPSAIVALSGVILLLYNNDYKNELMTSQVKEANMAKVILKSPMSMLQRVADFVSHNGEKVGRGERSSTYEISNDEISISVTYFGDNITALTVDGSSDFSVEDNEVVLISGDPKALLKAYDYEESIKDSL
jgi:hypothetical protein